MMKNNSLIFLNKKKKKEFELGYIISASLNKSFGKLWGEQVCDFGLGTQLWNELFKKKKMSTMDFHKGFLPCTICSTAK